MISDEDLLSFHEEGFIPGPSEGEKEFLQRISLTKQLFLEPPLFFEKKGDKPPFSLEKRIKKPIWSWSKTRLIDLYEISPEYFSAFFQSKGLSFLQGGVAWIGKEKVPLLQVRKGLEKGHFLWIYDLDEILSHEGVHAARSAFNEPMFEEFFAYMTSSKTFRKVMGPIFRYSWEVWVFFSLFITMGLFSFWDHPLFFLGSSLLLGIWTGLGLLRLFRLRIIFNKTFQKMKKHFACPKKALAFMVRLTDKEIIDFSRISTQEIKTYISKDPSLRVRVIKLLFF
jgi:hypothetical protein